jgi:hypothetical protein
MPMTITINGSSPPSSFKVSSELYQFVHPEAQAMDGAGAPCRAIGKPWCQIGQTIMKREVMAWLQAFFADGLATSVDVTVTGLFDPRANTTGTYTGKMLRPAWDAILSGWRYSDGRVKFVELVET